MRVGEAAVLAVPVLAWAMLGGVGPAERAALHLTLLLALLLGAGRATLPVALRVRWWRAWGALFAAGVVGLVPVPGVVRDAMAPAATGARGEGAGFLSAAPVATLEAVAWWTALAGVGLLLAASWRRWRPEVVEGGVAWAGLVVALVGAVHAATQATHAFGLWPARAVDGRFFGPLINSNHHGTLLLLALPFFVQRALRGGLAALGWGLAACWVVVYPWVEASAGLVLGLAAQVVVVGLLWPTGWARRATGLLGGAAALAGLGYAATEAQPEWWRLSGEPRLMQWLDTPALVLGQPWTGVGAGAYAVAYPPVRTVPTFATFTHAHSDPLEWLAETGLVGVVAVVVAVASLRPLAGAGRWVWAVSLAGGLAHAAVDFPLQVPAVALAVVAVLAGWLVVGATDEGPSAPVVSRPALAVVAQAACVGLWAHHAVADRWAVACTSGSEVAADRLAAWAPWRPEPLARAVRTASGDELSAVAARVLAEQPGDASLLRVTAARLFDGGDAVAARVFVERSLARDPNDFRAWWLRALLEADAGRTGDAASSMAEAMRHWPRELSGRGEALDDGFAWRPDALWWLDALADAPAHWSNRLAWLCLRVGEPEVALLATEQAARLRPDTHRFNTTRVEALLQIGLVGAATEHVDGWLQAEPEDAWAWYSAALVGAATTANGEMSRWPEADAVAGLLGMEHAPIRRRVLTAAAASPDGAVARVAAAWKAREAGDEAACEGALASLRGVDWARWGAERPWSCAVR